ncbi:MAG: diaminopimelate epimerase [Gammaproteobacteria bacterium]|nr:diaminopimelate epimerase [Gammaproteobacteria bacterium]
MNLKFTKMHGLGNDFVVIDGITQVVNLDRENIKFIADRRFGVGCDQILLIESPRSSDTDFFYRIFNADGGEVEQCGNGARCLARFVMDKALTTKKTVKVATNSGVIELMLQSGELFTVNMGVPRFEPEDLPMITDKTQERYILKADEQPIEIGIVSMGNPHAVVIVDDVDNAPVATTGKSLATHSSFPEGINAGFMEIVSRCHIKLRVYERGSGETMACGTGACAAVAYGRVRNLLDERVEVDLKGGRLSIQWNGNGGAVLMTGPAQTVFEGNIEL